MLWEEERQRQHSVERGCAVAGDKDKRAPPFELRALESKLVTSHVGPVHLAPCRRRLLPPCQPPARQVDEVTPPLGSTRVSGGLAAWQRTSERDLLGRVSELRRVGRRRTSPDEAVLQSSSFE